MIKLNPEEIILNPTLCHGLNFFLSESDHRDMELFNYFKIKIQNTASQLKNLSKNFLPSIPYIKGLTISLNNYG